MVLYPITRFLLNRNSKKTSPSIKGLYQKIYYKYTTMFFQNRFCFLAYKALFILLCLWGLYLNSGLPQGSVKWHVMDYYTIQSNMLCLFYFIWSFYINLRYREEPLQVYTPAPRLKGAVTFCITVTLLIYNFILAPVQFSMGNGAVVYSVGNILVHYVVPVMVVLDWLMFDKKGAWRIYDPFLWLGIPYAYFLFAIVRAQVRGLIPGTQSRYPYEFIDIDRYGWQEVGVHVVKLTLIFLLIGFLYVCIDHLFAKVAGNDSRNHMYTYF